jgi:hypothetical protein
MELFQMPTENQCFRFRSGPENGREKPVENIFKVSATSAFERKLFKHTRYT